MNDTLIKKVVEVASYVPSTLAYGASGAVDLAVNTEQRLKEAETAHQVGFDSSKSRAERCKASRRVKDAQKVLGSVLKSKEEYELPIISFKTKDTSGNDVSVKTVYWGDGWIAGAGFGFDIIPTDPKYGGKTLWVDINYANFIEKINPNPNPEKIIKECNTVNEDEEIDEKSIYSIDDLVDIVGAYTIPAKYAIEGKPINVKKNEITYGEVSGSGAKRRKSVKRRRQSTKKSNKKTK